MGNITASRTQLKGDPRYNSLLVSKFVNCLMWDGKKTTAQRVFYDALDLIQERMPKEEPLEVFLQAVENVKPQIEVRSKRVGGAAYQVPMQVNRNRQQSLAIRWLLLADPRQERPPHQPEAGRRIDGRLQEGRRRHDPPRKRAPHGRRQQGLCPLRLVEGRMRIRRVSAVTAARGVSFAPNPPASASADRCASGNSVRHGSSHCRKVLEP